MAWHGANQYLGVCMSGVITGNRKNAISMIRIFLGFTRKAATKGCKSNGNVVSVVMETIYRLCVVI